MNTYKLSVQKVEKLGKTVEKLSVIPSKDIETREEEVTQILFTKLTMTTLSILRLIPGSKYYCPYEKDEYYWDITSLAALTRLIIDNYYVMFYLAIDEVNKDEKDFRFLLWKLHSKRKRINLLEKIKSRKQADIERLKEERTILRKEINENPFYQREIQEHGSKHLKKYRQGKDSLYLSKTDLSKKRGISSGYYESAYQYLSQYVHSYSFSLSQLRVFHPNDPDSINVITTIVNYCASYLSISIKDFVKVFPKGKNILSDDINRIIIEFEYLLKNAIN